MNSDTASWSSAYRANLEDLRAAQKPSRGTAVYSRAINRPLGRVVAAAAHTIGMTPNQATTISAILTGSAIVVLVTVAPGPMTAIVVPVLLAAGYVMDSVDGQLARLKGGGSLSGEWLDHTVDCFKSCMLHLAVLVSWYQFPPFDSHGFLAVPLMFEVVDVVTYFGIILMPALRSRVPSRPAGGDPDSPNPLRKWLLLPTDYGVVCWVFVLLAWPQVFAVAYTILFLSNGGVLVLALRKWWRELRALDELA